MQPTKFELMSGAAAAVFAAPFPAEAQRTVTMPRIGYLSPGVQGANEVVWRLSSRAPDGFHASRDLSDSSYD
jgi:hypothetical protein